MQDLWACPECGRRFANTNQWHSCIELSLAAHLATKTDHAVGIYRRVQEALHTCGEFRIHPQKTRIAFIARMTFAGVRLAKRWADLSFILPRPVDDTRVRSIEMYGPTSFGHTVRLEDPADVDAEVVGWLCEAHVRGLQETLDPHAEVAGVVGHALTVLSVPVRGRASEVDGSLRLDLPPYVAAAFAEHPHVLASIEGTRFQGAIRDDEVGWSLDLGDALIELGYGNGDAVDAFLTADL